MKGKCANIISVESKEESIISFYLKSSASDESRPATGISHMLEHMMFKGTNNYGAGEFSKIIHR
jgi:zinc protease